MDSRMHVRLIEIKQDLPGFDPFFGSWVCQDDLNIVVDVGPASTAGRLIDSLLSLGLRRVDFVLLTHIHIDHSGALADLLECYPMAKAICHEKAVENIVNPSKLWAGSLKVLGEIAEAYGPPKPIPTEKLIPHTQNHLRDLSVIETPGHAPHHLSYSLGNHLFAGEAGGNYFVIEGKEYLRPATPPRFIFDVCLKSVDRLLSLKDQTMCYAHYGGAESSHRLLKAFRNQLIRWKDIIGELAAGTVAADPDFIEECTNALLEKDPNLAAFDSMDTDTRRRERTFIGNAINGFVGWLHEDMQALDR
ncbi:MAG: MBL fold metallo-hydrolase [Thermodesulfobacteriota bacterium]|nr:MBL fold metallo-hydrolase [Thermodesulfobacteriota bacterium]